MSWTFSLDRGEMHAVFWWEHHESDLLEDQEGSGRIMFRLI